MTPNVLLERSFEMEDKILDGIDHAKLGKEGEDMVYTKLNKILDRNFYTLYPNFKIPHGRFDIDTIIIGPKGIIIFEVKNYSKPVIFDGDDVYLKEGEGPMRPDWDPRYEISRHSYSFLEYLRKGGFNEIQTRKAIIFPKNNSVIIRNGARTGIYVISGVDGIDEYIKNTPDNPRFTKEYCNNINQYLKISANY